MAPSIKLIFGAFPLNQLNPEARKEFISLLEDYGVPAIDTAFGYVDSEKILGELNAPAKFRIDIKAPGFVPGQLRRDNLKAAMEKSLHDLGVESVDTYYLHSPDQATPVSEIMDTIQELYEAGKFKHFGVSNFNPAELTELYNYASSKGYVVPTVYQGNYNAVARHIEADLFPLLRKLGIYFNAYSPLAGGFLSKSPEDLANATEDKGGRFDTSTRIGQIYDSMYNRPALRAALAEWDAISKESGICKTALACRWLAFSSALDADKYGDGIVLGARRLQQLQEVLEALKQGPLEDAIVKRIQEVWEIAKPEAPVNTYKP